ncbi:hypothetical protein TNCV_2124541 [Trichonephila clavipes]|uniref:Uncharacterized protein n=1 Tax=Trichonephila clavipes TaxID=2585209 RepID=A0A8X6RC51_TRICX|nr:hypothetical protein TNCV_2124541 [Trichonephila clavipes]
MNFVGLELMLLSIKWHKYQQHNLYEYGLLLGNRHSDDGPHIPTGNGIQPISFHAGIQEPYWEFESHVTHPRYAYYLVMIHIPTNNNAKYRGSSGLVHLSVSIFGNTIFLLLVRFPSANP